MKEYTDEEAQKALHLIKKGFSFEVVAEAMYPGDPKGRRKLYAILVDKEVEKTKSTVEQAKTLLQKYESDSKRGG